MTVGGVRGRIATWARALRRELVFYRRLLRDPRTPWPAKALLALAIGYLALPIDLIPDPIPVLGELDDLVIVPLLLWLGLRLVPPELERDLRAVG